MIARQGNVGYVCGIMPSPEGTERVGLSFYAFTSGWPGELRASLANFAISGERSDSFFAAAIRLRSLVIFSLRTRRRRISGLRLGADMKILLDSKAPSNKLQAQELLEAEGILREPAKFCLTEKNGLAFCQPILTDSLSQLPAFRASGIPVGMRSILVRSVFLTRGRTPVLRCRVRRPHIVARLTSAIHRGILARHGAVHVA